MPEPVFIEVKSPNPEAQNKNLSSTPPMLDAKDELTDPSLSAGEAPVITNAWGFFTTSVTCLGVIYGDVGTSPIYTFASCVSDLLTLTDQLKEEDILGITSMIFWALTLQPTLKYCVWILSASINGQGGTFALLALLSQEEVKQKYSPKLGLILLPLSLCGVALLIGDGAITPAISVISAIEGIQTYSSSVTHSQIVGISVVILGCLFVAQRWGTGRIGFAFGPITIVWFLMLGSLGIYYITFEPKILQAFSPHYAIMYFVRHGGASFSILGFVILSITGLEAMYADMGQFGASVVRWSWVGFVYPCLVLQYLGQGAMILHNLEDHDAATSVFFSSIPSPLFWPALVITTLATIIASQATITGVQIIIMQAINLQCFPRVRIVHQSRQWWSRVYIPSVNFCLAAATLALCGAFRTSANLVSMYGLTISMIMTLTTFLMCMMELYVWNWHPLLVACWTIFFLFLDGLFLGATITKFTSGGWLPVLFAIIVASILLIVHSGYQLAKQAERQIVEQQMKSEGLASRPEASKAQSQAILEAISPLVTLRKNQPTLVPTPRPENQRILSVFLTSDVTHVPLGLAQVIQKLNLFPERILLLQVDFLEVPYVPLEKRLTLLTHETNPDWPSWLSAAVIRVGFAEKRKLDIASLVDQSLAPAIPGAEQHPYRSVYFISNRDFWVDKSNPWFTRLWVSVFIVLHRNAYRLSKFFHLPPDSTVEISTRVMM